MCVGIEGISVEKKGISFQLRSLLHENKVGASTMKGKGGRVGDKERAAEEVMQEERSHLISALGDKIGDVSNDPTVRLRFTMVNT